MSNKEQNSRHCHTYLGLVLFATVVSNCVEMNVRGIGIARALKSSFWDLFQKMVISIYRNETISLNYLLLPLIIRNETFSQFRVKRGDRDFKVFNNLVL